MASSISVLLPVHNAEHRLADRVGRLLELLSDLEAPFELVIIDDGSTDATSDVARELARAFPQVRCARLRHRSGTGAALLTGMAIASGERVVVEQDEAPLSLAEFRELARQCRRQARLLADATRRSAPPQTTPRPLARLFSGKF